MRRPAILLAAAVAAWVPSIVAAQDAAPDEAEAVSARATDAVDADDDMALRLNLGAALAYGNARNFAMTVGGAFQLRRSQHAFLVEVGWVYGLAAVRADPMGTPPNNEFGDFAENANNLTGLLRYDYFADNDNAVFISARLRNDPFARLQPRFSAQLGYLHNFFREENHRFWTEVGVDFTFDRFGEALAVGGVDATGAPVTSTDRGVGSLRVFIGYDNQINTVLTYRTGLEVLWGPLRTVGADQTAAMRFEWVNQLRSRIEDWLQISLDVTGRLDAAPPGQIQPWDEQPNQATQMFDLLTTLNLLGTFDLDGSPAEEEEEAAEEPACEPTVCPECAEVAPPAPPEEEAEPMEEAQPAADDAAPPPAAAATTEAADLEGL